MSSYPIFIQLEPGQAGWWKVREREEPIKTYKDKGGPLGTAADRLAGTAVDCVISWKSLSLTFLALDIFVWCCHCLLNRLAPDMSESWQSSVLPISLNLDNLSCCLLFVWACFSPQHFNLLTSLSGTVFWYGLHLSCLNLDSVFLVESSLHFPTLFSSWHTLVSPCCFLHVWEIEIKTTAGVFPIRKCTGCCSDGRTDMWTYSVLPKFWSWSTGTHEGCQSTSSQSTSITARCHSSSHCGVHFCGNLSNGFDRSKHFSENSWGTPAATTSHSKTSAHIAFAFTQSVFDPSQSAFALLSTQFQLRAGFLAQPPMPIVRCCTRNTC